MDSDYKFENENYQNWTRETKKNYLKTWYDTYLWQVWQKIWHLCYVKKWYNPQSLKMEGVLNNKTQLGKCKDQIGFIQ